MTEQNVSPKIEQAAPRVGSTAITLTVEPVDGGAVLRVSASGPKGATSGSGIVGGDITSAAAQRKIQKMLLRWVREAVNAPKITRKAKTPATA